MVTCVSAVNVTIVPAFPFDRLWCVMSFVFAHGFLPDTMLEIVLVPVIKDKTGRIDQVDNYRPIALASV